VESYGEWSSKSPVPFWQVSTTAAHATFTSGKSISKVQMKSETYCETKKSIPYRTEEASRKSSFRFLLHFLEASPLSVDTAFPQRHTIFPRTDSEYGARFRPAHLKSVRIQNQKIIKSYFDLPNRLFEPKNLLRWSMSLINPIPNAHSLVLGEDGKISQKVATI